MTAYDLTADFCNWEWSWGHLAQTTLDLVGLLPVVGVLKYGDEAFTLVKHSDEALTGAKHGDELALAGEGILKYADDVSEEALKVEKNVTSNVDQSKNIVETTGEAVKGVEKVEIWSKIQGTAGNMPGTEIPATFQIKVEGNFSYKNPTTETSILWTNANATEHMGEYISRFGLEVDSIGIRSQVMLESYSASLNLAMEEIASLPPGKYFKRYGDWELGINTETGVVYHAHMK